MYSVNKITLTGMFTHTQLRKRNIKKNPLTSTTASVQTSKVTAHQDQVALVYVHDRSF